VIVPRLAPQDLVGWFGLIEKTDGYDRWRASLPAGAYASSRRWVEYAGPETLALQGGAAWLTGGLSLGAAGLALREHLLAEADDLRDWAERHGAGRFQLDLALVFWEYTVRPLLGPSATVRVPHLAFSVRRDESGPDAEDEPSLLLFLRDFKKQKRR
jgi:hypothetical protein